MLTNSGNINFGGKFLAGIFWREVTLILAGKCRPKLISTADM
jgi:hypothetical protein